MKFDVVMIGGGPSGSTCASLLKKYMPELSVGIFEREKFPRDHIGESQLPPISKVLDEMGCWEDVEKAGFPLKMGGCFRWGKDEKLWDFNFVPLEEAVNVKRPGTYKGLRERLAFQVDRSIYDDILLKHARKMGAEVFEETKVAKVNKEGDRVISLTLENGEEVTADFYLDCSGNAATLRKAMGVKVDAPTKLQNVAFWDYWTNTEWAFQFPGNATRILVLSIGAGWIWYIPITNVRTSIGFVCPAEYYKKSGKSPTEIYEWALAQEPLIKDLIKNGSPEGKTRATKDWSFLSERMVGENWALIGECAGFADPILSAGLTLAQTGAREAAYTIMAQIRKEHDPKWMWKHYEQNQSQRITQHIRFADFWYSANGVFKDCREYTSQIAADAGLELDAESAFRWLGTGGFTEDVPGQAGIGGLDLAGARQVSQIFFDADFKWKLAENNILRLNLDGADLTQFPSYYNGKIIPTPCYVRGSKKLVVTGMTAVVVSAMQDSREIAKILQGIGDRFGGNISHTEVNLGLQQAIQVLEIMLGEGWISGSFDPEKPALKVSAPRSGKLIYDSHLNDRINDLLGNSS